MFKTFSLPISLILFTSSLFLRVHSFKHSVHLSLTWFQCFHNIVWALVFSGIIWKCEQDRRPLQFMSFSNCFSFCILRWMIHSSHIIYFVLFGKQLQTQRKNTSIFVEIAELFSRFSFVWFTNSYSKTIELIIYIWWNITVSHSSAKGNFQYCGELWWNCERREKWFNNSISDKKVPEISLLCAFYIVFIGMCKIKLILYST